MKKMSRVTAVVLSVLVVLVAGGCGSEDHRALEAERGELSDLLDRKAELIGRYLESARAAREQMAAAGSLRGSHVLGRADAILSEAETARNLLIAWRGDVRQLESSSELEAVRESADDLSDAAQCALETVTVVNGLVVVGVRNGHRIDQLFCTQRVRHDHPFWPGGPASQMPQHREALLRHQVSLVERATLILYEDHLVLMEQRP